MSVCVSHLHPPQIPTVIPPPPIFHHHLLFSVSTPLFRPFFLFSLRSFYLTYLPLILLSYWLFSHQVGSEGQVEDQSETEHCRKLVSFTLSGGRTDSVELWCSCGPVKNKHAYECVCSHFRHPGGGSEEGHVLQPGSLPEDVHSARKEERPPQVHSPWPGETLLHHSQHHQPCVARGGQHKHTHTHL